MKTELLRISLPFAIFLCAAASAQPTRLPQLGETIEVSIVNVDVFVTDEQGHRVRGLTKDDFEIRDNGKRQPITNFTEYAPLAGESVSVDAAGAAAETPAAAAVREPRTIVVFIEWFSLPRFRTEPMYASLRKLLRDTVRPGDAVSIVSWSNVMNVRLDFTDDFGAIDRVLSEIERETTGADLRSAMVAWARQQDAFARAWNAALDAAAAARGLATLDPRSHPGEAYAQAKLEMFKIEQKGAALNSLMQSISGLPGKKIVLMATHRFGLYAGAEFFGGEVPFMYRGELDTRKIRESVVRTANANNITLYPLYPVGLAWTPEGADVSRADIWNVDAQNDIDRAAYDNRVLFNETAALDEVAEATGGAMAWGSKDIVQLLPRIGDDLESYYSLGYRTPAAGKDVQRRIVVKAKNPAYVVRARQHYVEKSDATKMGDRVIAALFRPLDAATIPVEASLGQAKKTGRRRWSVPLVIRVPIRALTTLTDAGGAQGAFSVFLATGGVVGVISHVTQRTQPFTIPVSDLDRARASHFTYKFDLTVDDITERVSIGVLDETSKEFGLALVNVPPRESVETTSVR